MSIKYCCGAIGGKPRRALYFVGSMGGKLIYLDPHYVQKAEEQMQEDTYFCDSFRMCSRTAIDPSLGIAFYARDAEEINDLHLQLRTLCTRQPDLFIYMDDHSPVSSFNYPPRIRALEDSGDFERIG